MNFLANENVPGRLIDELVRRGHDVARVSVRHPGMPDQEVIRIAREEGRIVLTRDKGYGEIAFRKRPAISGGIVLLRLVLDDDRIRRVADALEQLDDQSGFFVTIDENVVRIRRLRSL